MSAPELTLLSWNTGERFRWPFGRATSDASLSDVAARLRGWNPHLALLQEIGGPRQVERLTASLGPGWHGALTSMPRSDREIALLSRIPREQLRTRVLDTSVGRQVLACEMPFRRGTRLHVLGCHGNAFSASARAVYFSEILDHAAGLPAADTVLLVGDFNMDPLLGKLTGDARVLDRLERGYIPLLDRRAGTCMGLLHLDHAFLRLRGAVAGTARVIEGTAGFKRDHAPIEVRLGGPAGGSPGGSRLDTGPERG